MPEPVAVVGAGRLGGAFVRALRAAGVQVEGPLGRGERPRSASRAAFRGAGAAVAGESPEAVDTATALAGRLGMAPFAIDDGDRGAYHAAASIASNFTVTLMASAERVARAAGLEPDETRALLAPHLVRSTVDGWAQVGPERALTGPVARADEHTMARQRDAVAEHAPELLDLFDALTDRTRALAGLEAFA